LETARLAFGTFDMARLNSMGIGGHQRAFRGETDVWLTPPEVLKALSPFDLEFGESG